MFFDTFWALILGFVLSGLVQALISRERMQQILGDGRPKTIGKATFYGMVSSSCSYAASALSRSIFIKGRDFTASMVFMFASTNLVIELGIVLWLLIGWQFAAAEFVGGAIMITLLALILPRILKESEIKGALEVASRDEFAALGYSSKDSTIGMPDFEMAPIKSASILRRKLSNAAGYTIGDFTMLRVELVVGFIVAGLATTVVPFSFWRSLFISGHGFISVLENAIIGPFLAFISFVCSVGNVPLAAALWSAGITFGGVIAFIFADLLAFPLVMIYRKYYGKKFALKLVLTFWFVMSLSGMLTEAIFNLLNLTPERMSAMEMSMTHFGVNATTILNGIALLLFAAVVFFHLTRPDSAEDSEFGTDPICGMQVRKSDAPASAEVDGVMYYFCMDGCKASFLKQRA